jgi:glycerophosphoryl diester phosphodiesterase
LDTKFHSNLQIIRDLQAEFTQKAVALGKPLEILIGIPDKDVLKNFEALENFQSIPSVCELDPPFVAEANSRVWGPRWTNGLQNEGVELIHSQGRRAFVWTLDHPDNIQEFMKNGDFDGILTDYPSAVAYYYYVQQ